MPHRWPTRHMPTHRGPQPMLREAETLRPEADHGMGVKGSAEGRLRPTGVLYRSAGLSQKRYRNHPQGDYTGAPQPKHPAVFRRFGANTRETVGYRRTGIWDNQYDADVVESRPQPALLPPGATLAQAGVPALLEGIPALAKGPHHWLFH